MIASHSAPIVALAKYAVNAAEETSLTQGLALEKSLFTATFATEDQKLGMSAFTRKQAAQWKHQ